MALSEAERKAMADYQALVSELNDSAPAPQASAGNYPRVSTTNLSDSEEAGYQAWKKTLPPRLQSDSDYDLRGFYKKNPKWSLATPDAHMTDEFKLPNHPTFSNESRYYNPQTKDYGGHWAGDIFIPNDATKKSVADEYPGKDESNALSFLARGAKPAPPVETRPFLHNTGPDLQGQFKRDISALPSVDNNPVSNALRRALPDARPGDFGGPRYDDPIAHDPIAQMAVTAPLTMGVGALARPLGAIGQGIAEGLTGSVTSGNTSPSGLAIGAGLGALGRTPGSLDGAVERSAARAPGAVASRIGDIGRALKSPPSNAELVAWGLGVPASATRGIKAAVPAVRAGAVMADEGLAAAGRAIGIKPPMVGPMPAPYSPANYAAPPSAPIGVAGEIAPGLPHPVPRMPEAPMSPPVQSSPLPPIDVVPRPVPRPAPPAPRQLGPMPIELGPMSDTGGVPRPVSPFDEVTAPHPFTAAERAAGARDLRNTFGGDIKGVTDAVADAPSATSELQTVAKGNPGWSRNARGTGYEKVDTTPSNTNVKPAGPEAPVSPKMQAYRDRLKEAEDTRFAKGMGMGLQDYRAMLARRAARVPQSLQRFQQTGDESTLRKDISDAIFEDDAI